MWGRRCFSPRVDSPPPMTAKSGFVSLVYVLGYPAQGFYVRYMFVCDSEARYRAAEKLVTVRDPTDVTKEPKDIYVCLGCLRASADLAEFKRCGGCHEALYCSPRCQKADWRNHKGSCVAMRASAEAQKGS
ncbi:hypothetical protein DFJ74DRAFT_686546 [Hyaloraphidium curvatum]|nr:hypothetical protein DFJ74DRAFT_686546 [Hyaloraphidium curvatum]